MTAFFVRNIQTDEVGRSIGRMDGYQPGHDLEMVQSYAVLAPGYTLPQICEEGFALFNRGSGIECAFLGPSMSVGDLVLIEGAPTARWAYHCASVGFEAIDWEPRFTWLIEEERARP